jgi:hypothetical protein
MHSYFAGNFQAAFPLRAALRPQRPSAPDFVCGQLCKSDSPSGEGGIFLHLDMEPLLSVLWDTIADLTRPFLLPPCGVVSKNTQPSQSILYSLIFFRLPAVVQIELVLPRL